MLLKQSTVVNIPFLLTSASDNVSPITGLGAAPVVTISKNAASFAAAGGTVSEIGNGWYALAATTGDAGTLGALLLHATGTGANPTDDEHQVVLDLPGATVSSVTGAVGSVTGAVGSVTGAVGSVTGNVGGNVVGSVASVTGAVGSVTGAVGSVTGAVGSVTGNVGGTVAAVVGSIGGSMVGSVLGNVAGSVGSVSGNVGGNVAGSVGSVIGVVAADMVGIIGTALTETVPGYLALAFKKFFNVVTPTSTMNEITLVDTTTTVTNQPSGLLTTAHFDTVIGTPVASVSADIAAVEASTVAVGTAVTAVPGATWDVQIGSHQSAGSTGAALEAAAQGGGGGGGSSSSGGCSVVGYVDDSQTVVGYVNS